MPNKATLKPSVTRHGWNRENASNWEKMNDHCSFPMNANRRWQTESPPLILKSPSISTCYTKYISISWTRKHREKDRRKEIVFMGENFWRALVVLDIRNETRVCNGSHIHGLVNSWEREERQEEGIRDQNFGKVWLHSVARIKTNPSLDPPLAQSSATTNKAPKLTCNAWPTYSIERSTNYNY